MALIIIITLRSQEITTLSKTNSVSRKPTKSNMCNLLIRREDKDKAFGFCITFRRTLSTNNKLNHFRRNNYNRTHSLRRYIHIYIIYLVLPVYFKRHLTHGVFKHNACRCSAKRHYDMRPIITTMWSVRLICIQLRYFNTSTMATDTNACNNHRAARLMEHVVQAVWIKHLLWSNLCLLLG